MLSKPRNAEEAFQRLTPDLDELSDCISNGILGPGERARLAHMVAAHFENLASTIVRPKLRLAYDRSRSV